mmetsp:Transcript_69784/g.110722  ORF Transcript_69784/g.110722 Transcript_69784/m.110722 type:complete len:206 (+) Transcript_69784:39-656(+)
MYLRREIRKYHAEQRCVGCGGTMNRLRGSLGLRGAACIDFEVVCATFRPRECPSSRRRYRVQRLPLLDKEECSRNWCLAQLYNLEHSFPAPAIFQPQPEPRLTEVAAMHALWLPLAASSPRLIEEELFAHVAAQTSAADRHNSVVHAVALVARVIVQPKCTLNDFCRQLFPSSCNSEIGCAYERVIRIRSMKHSPYASLLLQSCI